MATVVTMLHCYMLHVTLRSSHCALPPRAGKVERAGDGLGRRAGGRQKWPRAGRVKRAGGGLGRRAGGRQEWPWQEGDRDRGAGR